MLQTFGYISAGLSIIMIVPYVLDIFKHGTKPERASWLIWTVLGIIAFASQFYKGATDSLWLTAGQTVAVLFVFILSLKYGVGGLTKWDARALLAAAMGLIVWFFTDEPAWALGIVIAVDSIGSLITVIKSYTEPFTETLSTFVISGASGVFGLLAVGSWKASLVAYPVYIIVANYAIVAAILLGRRRERK
jgi:hypothetical protein